MIGRSRAARQKRMRLHGFAGIPPISTVGLIPRAPHPTSPRKEAGRGEEAPDYHRHARLVALVIVTPSADADAAEIIAHLTAEAMYHRGQIRGFLRTAL